MPNHELKNKTLKSVVWMLAGTGSQQGINLVIMMVLAHALAPSAFGLIGLAAVFIDILTIIGRAGLTEYLIQKRDPSQQELSTGFWTSFLFGVTLASLLFLLAPFLARCFGEPGLASILRWLSIACVFNTLGTVHEALLCRSFGFKALALRNVSASTVSGLIAVYMALHGFGVASLITQQIVSTGWLVSALWLSVRWVPSFQFSKATSLVQLRTGLSLVGAAILGTGNQKIIDLFVGYFLGTTALGYLRIAFKAIDVLYNICVIPVIKVANSTLAHLNNDPPAMVRAYLRLVQLTALVIFPVFLGSATVAPELVLLAFGPQWEPSIALMQISTLMAFFIPLAYYRNSVLMAAGRPDKIFFFSVISFAISLLICSITVQIGIKTTALGNALRFAFVTPISLVAIQKYAGVPIKETLQCVRPAMVSVCIMIAALWGLRLLGFPDVHPLLSMGITIVMGAAIYVGVLFVFFRKALFEAVKSVSKDGFFRKKGALC